MGAEEKIIAVENVEYVGEYKLALTFNDGKRHVVDFYPFLSESQRPDARNIWIARSLPRSISIMVFWNGMIGNFAFPWTNFITTPSNLNARNKTR